MSCCAGAEGASGMSEPYYSDDSVTLWHGDCLRDGILQSLADNSVDAIVTDPPYGLGFMGKDWDDLPPGEDWARECLRVLKPGGHLLAFGGTRTWHRLACAVEDAGFEVRDSIAWLYGNGFPKSLNVSKAIDKGNGENRARQLEFTAWMRSTGITARQINDATSSFMGSHYLTDRKQAAIATADMFDLLRNHLPTVPERIERLVAERTGLEWTDYIKRPLLRQVKRTGKESGTYGAFAGDNVETAAATATSERWQGWGTALKPAFEPIVVARKPLVGTVAANVLTHGTGALNIDECRVGDGLDPGRWPTNVVLDELQAAELDEQSGERPPGGSISGAGPRENEVYGVDNKPRGDWAACGDPGGASRFFYVAKADQSERVRVNGVAHPTVKPLALMRWLVRLVTPPGGTVLEPFAGSGTTVEACLLEGVRCIAIEREADYLPLIESRLARRLDPVKAVELSGDDGGLFDLLEGGVA